MSIDQSELISSNVRTSMLITPTSPLEVFAIEYLLHQRRMREATFTTFKNMNQRCYYLIDKRYLWYGGRGITVCERWKQWPARRNSIQFNNFCFDMGYRNSKEMSIDRIDSDGNYEPSNCRWIPRRENRQRKTRIPEFKKVAPLFKVPPKVYAYFARLKRKRRQMRIQKQNRMRFPSSSGLSPAKVLSRDGGSIY